MREIVKVEDGRWWFSDGDKQVGGGQGGCMLGGWGGGWGRGCYRLKEEVKEGAVTWLAGGSQIVTTHTHSNSTLQTPVRVDRSLS